jgi:hypothetical protein
MARTSSLLQAVFPKLGPGHVDAAVAAVCRHARGGDVERRVVCKRVPYSIVVPELDPCPFLKTSVKATTASAVCFGNMIL